MLLSACEAPAACEGEGAVQGHCCSMEVYIAHVRAVINKVLSACR
jgi:hypothetical protein